MRASTQGENSGSHEGFTCGESSHTGGPLDCSGSALSGPHALALD